MSKILYYAIVIALLAVGITGVIFKMMFYFKFYQCIGG